MAAVVDISKYSGQPYQLELALGRPQLEFLPFDLSVLEFYRNDPRYYYRNDDVTGSICIRDDSAIFQNEPNDVGDSVLLEQFGFCYEGSERRTRSLAAFPRYLKGLSPEHQQIWKAKQLTGNYQIHPGYYQSAVMGTWRDHVSIFDAFLEELRLINDMSLAAGRPRLFKNDYRDGRPRRFGFLVRPTLEAYNESNQLLDKLLSDNINIDFFQGDVTREEERVRADGRIEVCQKGSIAMLEEFAKTVFRPIDDKVIPDMVNAFRRVRKLRQSPAHAIKEDIFDHRYLREQRELMIDVYNGVRVLRRILESHPRVQSAGIKIPEFLRESRIWTE